MAVASRVFALPMRNEKHFHNRKSLSCRTAMSLLSGRFSGVDERQTINHLSRYASIDVIFELKSDSITSDVKPEESFFCYENHLTS